MSMDKREHAVPWSFQGKGDIYIDAFPKIQLVTGWAVEVTSAEAALKVLGVDPIKGSLPEDYYYEEPLYKALTRMGRELKVKYKVCDQEDAILPYPPFKCFMCSDLPRLMVEGRNRYVREFVETSDQNFTPLYPDHACRSTRFSNRRAGDCSVQLVG